MLKLSDIKKDYVTGDTEVHALKGISAEFRDSEFVSILGQSGCGKTTMLNIIGGLDRFSGGDLIINGKSTKDFKDSDWDSYRNHSIGFVFQSYNLIPHQNVLTNVELALTLSGVSKAERKKRAKEALEKVGLGDQLYKKPNQMSGGQMQRVAIARALVNDPDILLADEPTGALDSATSVQIMELLKEISKDKLIIMVTHNPELAEKYSTRIIRLLDGQIVDDSDPFTSDSGEPIPKNEQGKTKKTSMSFLTALSLSLNNLMSKKGRTFLTAFAGSIGIIGIALILSLSSGVRAYIAKVEEDTLSSYPISIEGASMDMTSMMESMQEMHSDEEPDHPMDKIYSVDMMNTIFNSFMTEITANDLSSFKEYIENGGTDINNYVSDIKYSYTTPLTICKTDTSDGIFQINPTQLLKKLNMSNPMFEQSGKVWREISGNEKLLASQYDVIAGRMPEKYNEVVIFVNKNNEMTDYSLYCLGLRDEDEFMEAYNKAITGELTETESEQTSYTYDELLDLSFKLLINTDYFAKQDDIWTDKSNDTVFMTAAVNNAEEIKVVGILRPNDEANLGQEIGTIGYRPDLMEYLINKVNDSEIVKEQKENPDIDVFTGIEFPDNDAEEEEAKPLTMEEIQAYIMTLPPEEQAQITASLQQAKDMGMSDEQIAKAFAEQMAAPKTEATYDGNLEIMGVADLAKPSAIYIYPNSFEAKDSITAIISDYNEKVIAEGNDNLEIRYTDIVGLMMSSVTTIINAITYILIAFVAISLVVSSIMIGIITYISVLERTKEIGILRSIGASKRDISRVFNAETMIVGFSAGAIGIIVTELLNIPINIIVENLTDISNLSVLPPIGGAILVAISVILTLIAGLIPSGVAARKDPVTALRTE